jgi:hypothetical protein
MIEDVGMSSNRHPAPENEVPKTSSRSAKIFLIMFEPTKPLAPMMSIGPFRLLMLFVF